MTQNQISYWNMVYDNRHKERADAETARSNYAKEVETQRSNKQNEALKSADVFGNLELNQNKLYETIRHDKAQEELGLSELAESTRHNRAFEENQSSGVLRQWVETGLNPLWYTNALPAAATAALGYWTLPTQQYVTSNNIDNLVTDIKGLAKAQADRANAVKQKAQEVLKSATTKIVDSTKSIASGIFNSSSKTINNYARHNY